MAAMRNVRSTFLAFWPALALACCGALACSSSSPVDQNKPSDAGADFEIPVRETGGSEVAADDAAGTTGQGGDAGQSDDGGQGSGGQGGGGGQGGDGEDAGQGGDSAAADAR